MKKNLEVLAWAYKHIPSNKLCTQVYLISKPMTPVSKDFKIVRVKITEVK